MPADIWVYMTGRIDRLEPRKRPDSPGIDLSAFLDSIPDGCFAVACDWTVTYLNRACEKYVGRDRSEILGRPVWDAHLALRGSDCERELRAAMAERAVRRVELSSALHPGHVIELRSFPAGDGLAVVLRDITMEKRYERTLRDSEERFRELADEAPAIIFMAEASGALTYISRRWYECTGQAPGTASEMGWLQAVHPDDRAGMAAKIRHAHTKPGRFAIDYRVRRVDGAWRWMHGAGEPRFGEDGAFLGYIGSVMDITERKQAEERLRLVARELDHRAKNILALVQVLIRQTKANSVEEFVKVATGRLYALGRAHTLLSQTRWAGADLCRLIQEELALFRMGPTARVRFSGPAIGLGPEAAQSLAMTLHELTTNATKHGALSVPQGTVDLEWTGGGKAPLVLRWCEKGGPEVRAPKGTGVGLDVIRRIASDQLGGCARFDWRPDGLVCDVVVPADKLVSPAS